tara:strand:- start:429142 stop:430353 length:1212 start_codon:yes stop_codon:yes gene_type:complete
MMDTTDNAAANFDGLQNVAPVTVSSQAKTSALTETVSADARRVGVSVVVPTYQESENIEELVERVSATFAHLDEWIEIIIVDDASRDGTDEKIAQLQSRGRNVRMIERIDERGLSSAVLRGFDEAQGEILVCMDADLSHPPETLPTLIGALRDRQAEMVVGSRYVQGGTTDETWGFFRHLNSRVATMMARPFTKIKDPMAGFFAVPREVYLRTRDWDPVGYKIGLEILVKTKCRRVEEVPIHFTDRRRGESKLSLVEQLNYLRHLGRLGRFKFQGTYQASRFALVGASGAIVDLTCFAFLLSCGYGIPVSRAVAISTAVVWNFAGNDQWVFRKKTYGVFGRFQKYLVSCSVGAAASYFVTVFFSEISPQLAAHPLPLAAVGIGVGAIVNFWFAKHWVFVEPKS